MKHRRRPSVRSGSPRHPLRPASSPILHLENGAAEIVSGLGRTPRGLGDKKIDHTLGIGESHLEYVQSGHIKNLKSVISEIRAAEEQMQAGAKTAYQKRDLLKWIKGRAAEWGISEDELDEYVLDTPLDKRAWKCIAKMVDVD
ncbi:hypothetical protein J7T55_002690 [Diaporthe amygdali]|uniref:uncharacterized protein n=1 Tax=Phomopsis amygdali TaxID=1214568 RepID=UPI0022FDC15F|nr:uncharacterized protein J7T55_002690 [Diaporthe amygdali]KAJ0122178.1 hypothetical protein J7T55_002690 [Diaporthe amygdali]